MGQVLSKEQREVCLQDTIQYEECLSDHLGPITIFRQNKKPYRYYLRHRQTAIQDNKTQQRLKHKQQWYQLLPQHKNMVALQLISLRKINDMCINKIMLDLFATYYNYTLLRAVNGKTRRQLSFKDSDLMYILESLISVGLAVQQHSHSQYTGWFSSLDQVYLSPEGFVKVYPFPIIFDPTPHSSPVKQAHSLSVLANQELELEITRRTSESSRTLSPTKPKRFSSNDDLRDIGVLMLQLLLLNREGEVRYFSPQKLAHHIDLLASQRAISKHLQVLVEKMLFFSKETSYAEIDAEIKRLREGEISFSYCIRLDDGPTFMEPAFRQRQKALEKLSAHQQLRVSSIKVLSRSRRLDEQPS